MINFYYKIVTCLLGQVRKFQGLQKRESEETESYCGLHEGWVDLWDPVGVSSSLPTQVIFRSRCGPSAWQSIWPNDQ